MENKIEVSIQEFQQMLIDGKISTVQMVQILRENLGDASVMHLLGSLMKEGYEYIDFSESLLRRNENGMD